MQNQIHPSEKYPFDVEKLTADIRSAVENFHFYTTSLAIEKIITLHSLSNSSTS